MEGSRDWGGFPKNIYYLAVLPPNLHEGIFIDFFHPSDCVLTAAAISVLCVFEDYQLARCVGSVAASPPRIPISPAFLSQLNAHRFCSYREAPTSSLPPALLTSSGYTSCAHPLLLSLGARVTLARRLPASPVCQALLCRHLSSSLYWEIHPLL